MKLDVNCGSPDESQMGFPWLRYYEAGAYSKTHEGIKMKACDFIYNANKKHLTDIALTYFGVHITYQTLFEKINEYAIALQAYGVQPGDYVSICLPNIPETVYFKYALNKIGAVANMIEPRTNSDRIAAQVNQAKSKLLIVIGDICRAKIHGIIDKLRVQDIVVVWPSDSLKGEKWRPETAAVRFVYSFKKRDFHEKKYIQLREFLHRYKGTVLKEVPFVPDRPAVVLYTSGTTGTSKGAQISNEAYNAMAKQMSYGAERFDRGDTFLGCIPFFSAYGSLCGMHDSLAHGWNIILIPTFNPNEFDKLLKKYRPNNALGVPRFWESVVNNGNLNHTDLSFLKNPVTGGDKIAPATLKSINAFFKEHGSEVKLKVGYGATEFGGVVSTTYDGYPDQIAGSVGPFLPGCVGIVIDHATGKRLDYGKSQLGEICIYSPSMMLGYLNHPEETEEITYYDQSGRKFYKTGDKGYISADGIVWIVDRYKRVMMRPDGHTVHAAPIENVLMSHPNVASCAVVGLAQEGQSGTIPTAFVCLKGIGQQSVEDLVDSFDALCLQNLPERNRPLAYTVVESIPYTLMGKVDFKQLENKHIEDLQLFIVDHTFFD